MSSEPASPDAPLAARRERFRCAAGEVTAGVPAGLLFAALLLPGCMAAAPESATPATAPPPRALTVMNGYPSGFAGCSCSFARNQEAFQDRQFVYLESYGKTDDTENYRMVALDGEAVRWPRDEDPEGFEFELRVDRERRTDLEVREIVGSMSLRFPDGAELQSPIFGRCGC